MKFENKFIGLSIKEILIDELGFSKRKRVLTGFYSMASMQPCVQKSMRGTSSLLTARIWGATRKS